MPPKLDISLLQKHEGGRHLGFRSRVRTKDGQWMERQSHIPLGLSHRLLYLEAGPITTVRRLKVVDCDRVRIDGSKKKQLLQCFLFAYFQYSNVQLAYRTG